MPHVPVVGIILRVEVNSVWEDTQIRAHGHELLFSRLDVHRRHVGLHGSAIDVQDLILHPAQRIPRADCLHSRKRLHRPPPRPRRKQRIAVRRQILHVIKFPVRKLQIVIIAEERFGGQRLLPLLRQLRIKHPASPLQSEIRRFALRQMRPVACILVCLIVHVVLGGGIVVLRHLPVGIIDLHL